MGAPDWGLSDGAQVNVEESKLGDGYVFRQAKGLNHKRSGWSPSWTNLDPVLAQVVYDWLDARRKLVPVRWLHPVRNVYFQVTVEDVTLTWDVWNNATLSITFEQDFNPV
ncbi:minor tail protein [Pseudomonas phage Lana]|uniref:Phage tail protein n=1 Tax=Pseudomonas phage Lana TaxID=2530172 RepID=A0A481W7T4_9CAUD|nr:minor tail protein [Pseudomonas phage Lana]QBJ04559.1 hypothetical protein [Pseudomonas phage Lana]